MARERFAFNRSSLWILFALALTISLAWSVAVPVFESPDEPHHWQYARFLHDEQRLPMFGPDFVEANSPPLYYMAIAPVSRHTPLPPHLAWLNADGALVLPMPPRFYLNAGDDLTRYWPIRAARLITAVLTACAVLFVFRAGVDLGGTVGTGVLAAGFVAFLPQFAFRSGTISNDSLVTTGAAAFTCYVVGALNDRLSVRDGFWTGVWLSVAYLSKINAVGLIFGVLAATLLARNTPRQRGVWTMTALGTAGILVAPWSIRNVALYGDPFASGAMHTAVAGLIVNNPLSSPYFYTVFPNALARSFIGVFGWMSVWMSEAMYGLFAITFLVGMAGLLLSLARRRDGWRAVAVLCCIFMASLAVVVHINRSFHQPQGRYLFPALPAIGLLWGLGMSELLSRWRRALTIAWSLVLMLAVLNAYILVRYIVRSYPPVVPTLKTSVARLAQPAYTSGLQTAADGWLDVTNGDPQVGFATNAPADEYAFLEFAIEGQCPISIVPGSVYFALDGGPGNEAQRVGFIWKADGIRRKVIVPLVTNTRWRGRATTLRIDPVEPAGQQEVGGRLRITDVSLRGAPE